MNQHRLYNFGLFCLDATAKVLLRDGQAVALTRKAVETLIVLVENAGQVVSKEEMINALWPDRVVDEANLTQNIAMVRRALAAQPGSPAYIETFPGRGYRLAGPVAHDVRFPINNDSDEIAAHDPPFPAEKAPGSAASSPRQWLISLVAIVLVASIPALWLLLRPKPPQVEAGFHVSPLTRLPGEERQPVISADGKRVAFLWQQGHGRSPAICIQVVGESSHRQITGEEGHYSSPAWSPDGKALAYLRTDTSATEVMIRSLETGQERLVTRFTPPNYGYQRRLLDWSPDGQWLVVSHTDSTEKPNGLFLVTVATGEKKKLTSPESMVGGDMDPRFSPDSRVISFIRNIHRSHQEIFSIPISGGAARQLTSDEKQISSHDWAAGATAIVFASDRGGEFRLWKLRPDSGASRSRPESVAIYNEFPMELSLARNASTLVYSVQPQDRNIWRLDLQEKNWTRIIASSAQDASPQYSPAGDKICFRSDRTGEEQLWVSDAAGGNQTQLTSGALYPSVGHWSPDGRRIAFNNARTGEIYLAEQAGDGNWSVRNLGARGVHPVFSPDGQWLYAGTTSSIIRLPASGGPVSQVVGTGGFSLGLSDDGSLIYFMRDANDTVLWKARTDNGELAKAVEGLIPNCTSCWALKDTGIYYLGGSKDSFDTQVIYFHEFASGRKLRVVSYPEPLFPVGSGPFSLSPDRRSLLCVRTDPSNSDIIRVEPFR